MGLLVLVFDRLLNEDAFQALFPPMYVALLFLAPVSASVAMYLAGFAAFPAGTVTHVLPVISGYYLLSRLLAMFFCDLRGFTAFTGRAEPGEVFDVIHDYYEEIGRHLQAYRAIVGEMVGDGSMAYLNDPEPCDCSSTTSPPAGRPIRTSASRGPATSASAPAPG